MKTGRTWTNKKVNWGRRFYNRSLEILGDGDKIRPALTQSYINTCTKVSILTSLALQGVGLHAFSRRGTGSIPGRELRSHKLDRAPHPKTISVCRDPVSHVHQDWATSTALPMGTHCSHKFLRITVS